MRWRLPGAVAALFLAAPAAAQQPAPAPVPPPAAAEASEDRLRAAGEAVAETDIERLGSDRAYAATIADHLLLLRAQPGLDAQLRYEIEGLLVYALASAERHDAAEAAADALIRMQPRSIQSYAAALTAAGRAERHPRLAAVIEQAAQAFAEPAQRATLFELATPERVGYMLHEMNRARDTASRARLAETLLRAGFPGPEGSALGADPLRMILIERHVEGGDIAAARRLVPEVRGLSSSLTLATDRRFDPLIGDGDRAARVRGAIDAEDRDTASRLAEAPEDIDRLAERAAFLRSVGRDRAVLDLVLPLMADPAIIVARGDKGLWLVNEAAHALISTGAAEEGVELMRPLASMNLRDRPELINTSINFISVLYRTGRAEEALREAERLAVAGAEFANDYGEMIIWAGGACAAASLGRRAESDAWLRRMEPKIEENPSAMLMALLCRGEMDRAERILISALESDTWRRHATLWFHDYDPRPRPAVSQRQHERFLELRARPAPQAAFQRVGHRLRLPMVDTVYGY